MTIATKGCIKEFNNKNTNNYIINWMMKIKIVFLFQNYLN